MLLHASVCAERFNSFCMTAGTEEGEDPLELSAYLASLQTVLTSKPTSDMVGSQQDFLMPQPRGERSSCAHCGAAYWAPRRRSCCPGSDVTAVLSSLDQLA